MRLGLQQPYFFPYLGYYQLLFAVDRFVAYDDAAWIKGGWINRNRMLDHGRVAWFTIPTRGASPNVALDSVAVADGPWRRKLRDRFAQAYSGAPFRDATLDLLERTLAISSSRVADLAVTSLETVRDYLGYTTPIYRARGRYTKSEAAGQQRVIEICREEEATEYWNTVGGQTLYNPKEFQRAGLALHFLHGSLPPYDQGRGRFEPGLSILDVLMRNSVEQAREMMMAWTIS